MDPHGRRALRTVVVALTACAVVGCGGDETAATNTPPAPPENAQPTAKGGPLMDLPPCEAAPDGMEADVPGLVLPDGAVVTGVEDVGQLVSVRAYVEQTPIQVRQFYAKEPGLDLFEIEDEVYEAEVLFGGEEHRTFVRAQAQCQQGSVLEAYVGPADTDTLPSVGS